MVTANDIGKWVIAYNNDNEYEGMLDSVDAGVATVEVHYEEYEYFHVTDVFLRDDHGNEVTC